MHSLELEISNQYVGLADPEAVTHSICEILEKSKFKIQPGTLSIVFIDEISICQIHETYLNDPSPTDVITFPADLSHGFSGEIFISIDEARSNADRFETNISDEITLYIVHGWLHLHGLNDKTEEEISTMRKAEKEALSIIKKADIENSFKVI